MTITHKHSSFGGQVSLSSYIELGKRKARITKNKQTPEIFSPVVFLRMWQSFCPYRDFFFFLLCFILLFFCMQLKNAIRKKKKTICEQKLYIYIFRKIYCRLFILPSDKLQINSMQGNSTVGKTEIRRGLGVLCFDQDPQHTQRTAYKYNK